MGTLTFQATAGGSVNLLGPNISGTVNLTLPSADGTSGQPLQTNGSGTLSFANLAIANGGTGVTSFAANQIHYGSFSQSANLTFNGTTLTANTLNLTNALGTAYGGTGLTSFTANGVVYASSTSALATGSAFVFDGTNVGIGTSSPARPLHVASASTSYIARFQNSGSALALINFKDNTTADFDVGVGANGANLVAYTGNTERMRIDSSGNVGIGTSSPTSKVSAVIATGGCWFGAKTAANSEQLFGSDSSGNASIFAQGANVIALYTSGTERMRIDSSGNVGIGTGSPSASAILDAQSTTKGVRMPNMTTTQKNAISSPAAGLMVFDNTLAKLCVYSGSAWQTVTSI
jgi:hypothetical protein